MKCVNCGSNYASKELVCPYCGSKNEKGLNWFQRREKARKEYENYLKANGVSVTLRTWQSVLSRIQFWVVLSLIVTIILSIIAFLLIEFISDSKVSVFKSKRLEYCQKLYEEQNFDELSVAISDSDFHEEEFYEYAQITLLYQDYMNFKQSRMEYLEDENFTDVDRTEYLLDDIQELLRTSVPAFSDITPNNQVIIERWQQEIEEYASNILGLSNEDLELLKREDYLYSEIRELSEQLVERAKANEAK